MYVFRLSKQAVFAPSLWSDWMSKKTEFPENPILQLKNPAFLPPWHLTLAPEVESDSNPLYAGKYTLDLLERHPNDKMKV